MLTAGCPEFVRDPKDMTISRHADCLIVGAGIAGLVAARSLQSRGFSVLILDKGRGVGGRLATRSFEGGRFDYGAQFFTVRNPAFRNLVEEWLAAGIVAPWAQGFHLPDGKFKDTGEVHYRGVGGMRTIATHTPSPGTAYSGLGWAGFYTAGIFFYALDRLSYFHAFWHLFVLAGSTCHYFAVLFYVAQPRV